jgi:hypothetical protein
MREGVGRQLPLAIPSRLEGELIPRAAPWRGLKCGITLANAVADVVTDASGATLTVEFGNVMILTFGEGDMA